MAAIDTSEVHRPRPSPQSPLRLRIVIEGFLKKLSTRSLHKPWQRRYFVVYANSMEIRYYGNARQSSFGTVPLDERGSIPLESIGAIVLSERDASRFAIHTGWGAGYPFPRDTRAHPTAHHASRIMWLEAPTNLERAAWIQRLTELTGVHPTSESVRNLICDVLCFCSRM